MAAFHFPLSFALPIALCVAGFSCIYAYNGGRSVELVHRDSPKSPFYNSQETSLQRLNNALRRSISNVQRFLPIADLVSPEEAESEVITNRGEYLMSLFLGTPPFEILAIADTGSDLVWTQCKPCDQCYRQVAPLFDPKSSKTYRDLSCDTKQCKNLGQSACFSNEVCEYSYSYGDQSFTKGNLAVDTVTLASTNGRPVSFPKTVFGCGHQNNGTFDQKGSGIIGLGGGPMSLISQMGSSVGGKFSYCLVSIDFNSGNSSKLHFGSNAEVSGSGVQSTPLVKKYPDTFYFLTLEAVSIGNNKIKFDGSSFGGSEEGNIIIDSGTTLTLFPEDFYTKVAAAVEKAVINGQQAQDPSGLLNLCYRATSDLKVPIITAHFSGADVKLQPLNTFVQVSEDVVCFACKSYQQGAVYGNIAQMNFLVGYDIEGKSVSFKPTDCSKT